MLFTPQSIIPAAVIQLRELPSETQRGAENEREGLHRAPSKHNNVPESSSYRLEYRIEITEYTVRVLLMNSSEKKMVQEKL